MGRCLTVIKLIGIGSIGISSTIAGIASYSALPELKAKVEYAEEGNETGLLKKLVNVVRYSYISFNSISAYMFYLAYSNSNVTGKHPYLIYCIIGSTVGIANYLYGSFKQEKQLLSIKPVEEPKPSKVKKVVKQKKPKSVLEEERSPLDGSVYNDLGKSMNVEEESTSEEEVEVEIEEISEVANDELKMQHLIQKTELETGLSKLTQGYLQSFYIVAVTFGLSVIGFMGDTY
ncbi:hypothetical protein CANARDRAFT_20649 [[Candida] arabinofermentans NRRL YB-2248]|uniref:Autophagy-related protein 33 n=1 Tax=[Candida] arabinofermentans NRRL YB-2248 TaxID=983967 RepID=A0A1E4T866_9ASCO|nr:hypothetical protein CANARDRAFT_20649 [[Candida] arabinofermentans NRRL YB-2248]